jgi:hypothetical protein
MAESEWKTRKKRIDPQLDAVGWRLLKGKASAPARPDAVLRVFIPVVRATGATRLSSARGVEMSHTQYPPELVETPSRGHLREVLDVDVDRSSQFASMSKPFETPRPFEPNEIAKLAPAAHPQQPYLGVFDDHAGGPLEVWERFHMMMDHRGVWIADDHATVGIDVSLWQVGDEAEDGQGCTCR